MAMLFGKMMLKIKKKNTWTSLHKKEANKYLQDLVAVL